MVRTYCRVSIAALAALAVATASSPDAGGQAPDRETEAPKPAVVLDTTGFWRVHNVLKPPVVATDDGLKPVLHGVAWLDWETPEPAADWQQAGFDDGGWLRGPALVACRTPYLAQVCLRGKVTVTDPSKVAGLRLSVGYYGGAVAWVNGTEIGRANLPAGRLAGGALAEGYPLEVFVDRNDKLLFWTGGTACRPATRDAESVCASGRSRWTCRRGCCERASTSSLSGLSARRTTRSWTRRRPSPPWAGRGTT